jgi:colicin import membrane protein
MNKVYIIFPLIGLIIFGSFYVSFSKGYEAHLAEVKLKGENDKKAKAAQQIKDREKAIAAAIEASKTRAIERAAKEAADEAKKTARQEAEDRRQRTYDDRNKLRDQVSRLKKDLEDVKTLTAKVAEEKKKHLDEETFLKTYVKQAEANVKYYYDLIDKINAAEAARAAAEAAAAAAAKNKS